MTILGVLENENWFLEILDAPSRQLASKLSRVDFARVKLLVEVIYNSHNFGKPKCSAAIYQDCKYLIKYLNTRTDLNFKMVLKVLLARRKGVKCLVRHVLRNLSNVSDLTSVNF